MKVYHNIDDRNIITPQKRVCLKIFSSCLPGLVNYCSQQNFDLSVQISIHPSNPLPIFDSLDVRLLIRPSDPCDPCVSALTLSTVITDPLYLVVVST